MPSRAELEGMTTNERLWSVGLPDAFDAAAARRDEAELTAMLKSIFVDEIAIAAIIANVRQYGVPHDPTWTKDRL